MLIWGAVWGALIAVTIGSVDGVLVGAALGWLAAWTLRRTMRKEIDQRVAALVAGRLAQQAGAEVQPQVDPVAAASRPDEGPAAGALAAREREDAAPGPAKGTAPIAPPAWLVAARDWLFGGNTVVRLGAVLLFMGLAFLARYAVEQELLPPELRVAAIAAAGIALLLAGFRISRRDPRPRGRHAGYGWTLQGAGVAVLYLAVFAAYRLYALVPAVAAMGLMTAVCALSAIVALRQDARPLAALGLAGGFLAPILASSGEGSHVALFGYYALLDAAMLAIVARRGWRELSWIAFVGTFGVATAWGVLQYRPELYASTQPFLALFFAIFVAAALLHARRTGVVDTTLVFGTPLVAFGLQAALLGDTEFGLAFSALALAAVYLLLALALRRFTAKRGPAPVSSTDASGAARAADAPPAGRLLGDGFIALGVGFATLAVPLALDARWTSAVWALEGAGAFWVGQRQGRRVPRLAGIALQVLAWFALLSFLERPDALLARWPLAHAGFVGALLLALPALWIAYRIDRAARVGASPVAVSPGAASGGTLGARMARRWDALEPSLQVPLFFAGAAWWLAAFWLESNREALLDDLFAPVYPASWRLAGMLFACVASAHLSWWMSRRFDWAVAKWPAHATMPLMLVVALVGLADRATFDSGLSPISLAGALAWTGSIALHLWTLRAIDAGRPRRWFGLVHGAHAWLVALLLAHGLLVATRQAGLGTTAWPGGAMLASLAAVVLACAWAARRIGPPARWPLDRFAVDYALAGGGPLAVVALAAAVVLALGSDGTAAPLPSLPLFNPTDLSVALALAAVAAWITGVRRHVPAADMPTVLRGPGPWLAVGGVGFLALNAAWPRAAHRMAALPWQVDALLSSPLVQAGYALLWTVAATVLMVFARRRQARLPWMAGAALLALTVAKLFLVDLSNAGTTERIVAFIGVGLVMLLVGWVAPIPPARDAAKAAG